MRFANPIILFLLVLVPAIVWLFIKDLSKKSVTILFPKLEFFKKTQKARQVEFAKFVPIALKSLALALFVLGIARPQSGVRSEEIHTKGVDIILCIDTSGSMRAEDFKPNNRLFVAKKVAADFVKGRKHDRIGIVVFGGISFTQCPLTLDYGAVLDFLDKVEIGMTQTENTAIGTALATSVNRLKETIAKSKIIILVTDGRNNAGEIDPETAAKAGQAFGIKVYTIGVGSQGEAPYPVEDPIFGKRYVYIREDLDEDTLTKIAETTGGLYFRATTPEALARIYKQIDEMEKTEIKVTEYTEYTELYPPFLWIALILILTDIALANSILRRIP